MPESITLPYNPSPRIHDYTGLWCIQPEAGAALARIAKTMDWDQHVKTFVGSDDPQDADDFGNKRLAYTLHDSGVAEIALGGTLMKHESSMEASTSTVFARRALRQAGEDQRVKAIVLRIDSPGGTVSGTDDLGTDVARVNARKPVIAFAEDLMASAAYWVGCRARAIWANSPTALIGSIGTFMGLYDLSEAAAKEGVEALVFATGDLKATGFPGAKVTAEQRAYLQDLVDKNQVLFNATVQQGRGMTAEQVAQVATGAVWKAGDAQALGLIDGIKTFDEVLAYAAGLSTTPTTTNPKTRSNPMTATAKQIKEACTGADAEFVMSQLEAEASIEDAKTAYIDTLAARIQNRDERIKTLETEHKAKVDELATQHAEAIKAKDDALAQIKTDLANVQLGATDDQTTPASGSGDAKKPRTLADMVTLN